jgi:hypothetical protein
MSKEILDVCLQVTGAFENGVPNYQGVTGNFDGQGLSVGVLQWCAGQGSLGHLLNEMLQEGMPPEVMDSYFSVPVSSLISMSPSDAKAFCVQHFNSRNKLTPGAKSQWISLLSTQEAVDSQVALATQTVLATATNLANTYCPENPDNLRVISFMFDLVTQSGGMRNSRGAVHPVAIDQVDSSQALSYAQAHPNMYNLLLSALQENTESAPLASQLLYYAYERAKLSKPEFVWDAFSRRATIAARKGVVHGSVLDLTELLP